MAAILSRGRCVKLNNGHICGTTFCMYIVNNFMFVFIVEAEMSQKLSWRDLFVQIELGVDIVSLGIK